MVDFSAKLKELYERRRIVEESVNPGTELYVFTGIPDPPIPQKSPLKEAFLTGNWAWGEPYRSPSTPEPSQPWGSLPPTVRQRAPEPTSWQPDPEPRGRILERIRRRLANMFTVAPDEEIQNLVAELELIRNLMEEVERVSSNVMNDLYTAWFSVRRETDKAIGVYPLTAAAGSIPGSLSWLPKSQIKTVEVGDGSSRRIQMPKWLAIEKGFSPDDRIQRRSQNQAPIRIRRLDESTKRKPKEAKPTPLGSSRLIEL